MKLNRITLFTLLLALVSVLLVACGGKADSPTQVATKYFEALRDGDSGTVTQLLVPQARDRATNIISRASSRYPSAGKITAELVNEVGNTATVKVTYELTSEQAVEKAPYVNDNYRGYRNHYGELLSPEAYNQLFERGHRVSSGWSTRTTYVASAFMEEGEPLHHAAWEGIDSSLLERLRTNPPKIDQAAIRAIEEIGSGIDPEASFNLEQLEEIREQLRPHLAANSERFLYDALIDRGMGSLSLDPQKKTYVYPLEVTLHRVDNQWLVTDN